MTIIENDASEVLSRVESRVRHYSRVWPTVFDRAVGSHLFAVDGAEYIDFFSAAGSLNYGHNEPYLIDAAVNYMQRGGILNSLDMFTQARADLVASFISRILVPRGMNYRIQFCGPTGTNAVEAALKLARKITGRTDIIHFHGSFHGVSLGSLAVTSNAEKRAAAGVPLLHSSAIPYDDHELTAQESVINLTKNLTKIFESDRVPAAVIVECVQGEGGVNIARPEWVRALIETCRRFQVVTIVDDIQMGCGRTGAFFSFEDTGVTPDLIVLSKSLSGLGLPLSIVLVSPSMDVWEPGEHNGTFRGNNLAMITARAALERYWATDSFELSVRRKSALMQSALSDALPGLGPRLRVAGLAAGISTGSVAVAEKIVGTLWRERVLVETAGRFGDVIKLMPPLTISESELAEGLARITSTMATMM